MSWGGGRLEEELELQYHLKLNWCQKSEQKFVFEDGKMVIVLKENTKKRERKRQNLS